MKEEIILRSGESPTDPKLTNLLAYIPSYTFTIRPAVLHKKSEFLRLLNHRCCKHFFQREATFIDPR